MSQRSRYLLVVYMAAQNEQEPISPGTVARKLDRSPAATTEMLQRLEAKGLLTYEPYHGVTLTDEGRDVASDLSEKYVVLLRFFRDVLEVDEPEKEATELAGTVSAVVTDRLVKTVLDRSADEILADDESPVSTLSERS